MTDLKSEAARLDEPTPAPSVDPPAEPATVLDGAPSPPDPLEVERLRFELAVLKQRLRSVEELARERAGRIADLRVILRLLPPSSQPAPPAADPTASSVIWIPDRAGAAGPGQDRVRGSPGWSPPGSPSRPDPQSERIWQTSDAGLAEEVRPVTPVAPSVAARADAAGAEPPPRATKADWREDYRDFPRPRHRRAHASRLWLRRFRRSRG